MIRGQQQTLHVSGPANDEPIVPAANNRFSDNLAEFDQRLLETIAWVRANAAP